MAYAPPRDPTNVVGRRVVAYILDLILLWAIVIAILAATKENSFTGAPDNACDIVRAAPNYSGACFQLGSRVYTWDGGGVGVALLVGVGVWFANLVVLQGLTGASIGKMITGLRTVNGQGEVCGLGKALVRSLLLIVDSAFCALVGLITVLSTHPHKRVGDMVAKTYVVAASDVGTPIGVAPPPQYAYAAAQPGWGAQQPPPPAWGTNPPTAPAAAAPGWGAPAASPPPPPPPPTSRESWAPPDPTQRQGAFGSTPPPGTAAPASHWEAGATPAAPAPEAPASWGAPEPTPAPPPAPEPPAEAEPAPESESWWNQPGGYDKDQ